MASVVSQRLWNPLVAALVCPFTLSLLRPILLEVVYNAVIRFKEAGLAIVVWPKKERQ